MGEKSGAYGRSVSDLLLERGAEVAAIERAVRVARAGCGRLVIVAGPAGSGRSVLLERACARGAAQRLTVLAARGEEGERDFPFALARRLLETRPAAVTAATRYDDLLYLSGRLAALTPVLVAVDDLQLGDPASLEWLAFVARRLRRSGIALVVTLDVTATGLLTTFDAAGERRALHLRALGERAVGALLRVELGHAVDAEFVAACRLETAGNPLVVRAPARAARRAGLVPDREGADRVASLAVPEAGRLVLCLPEPANALARAVALLGGQAPLRDAAELAPLEPDVAAVAADRLRAAGLLTGGAALSVTPPLLARTLEHAIPPAQRALMHARAARIAKRTGAPPAAVARHLVRSEPSSEVWAIEILRHAAGAALARGDPGEAAAVLRRAAAEALPDGHDELLLARAVAARRLGDPAEARSLAAVTRCPGAETDLALALLADGRTAEALAVPGADAAEVSAAALLEAVAPGRPSPGGDTPTALACRAAMAPTADVGRRAFASRAL